jgi:protein involved in polysaccharide export with SLBB domain
MRILLFTLAIAFGGIGCTTAPDIEPIQIDNSHRVERIDVERLLAGDLRYNQRVRDGDVLIASDELLFADKASEPLGLITDRITPNRPLPPRYEMNKGDLLLITIYELLEPGVDHQQQHRVDEDGRIPVEHMGLMPAAGLSTSELERVLAQRLHDKVILRDATVSVQVLEAQRSYTLYLPGRASGETIDFQESELRVSQVFDLRASAELRTLRYLYLIREK